jgi:hypothetical protein
MDEEHKVLPLIEAYRFGAEHGLERELGAIREMEIEWDLSYTSSLRRGYVVDLFSERRLLEPFNEKYWPAGNTPWGRRKCDFWLRLKHRYEDFLAGRGQPEPEPDETDEDQAFAAETDLRDFLANNLSCVEPGLRLFHQGERSGVEFPVDDGRIDILAVDRADHLVVFELKVARGRNKVLGQLLYYMGWVDKHLGNGPCRGVIVAREISDDLIVAAQRVQGVSLYRYRLSVSVEPVS